MSTYSCGKQANLVNWRICYVHLIERERPYSIVTAVHLPVIDWKSFVTDILADRKDIEDYGKRYKAEAVRIDVYICKTPVLVPLN